MLITYGIVKRLEIETIRNQVSQSGERLNDLMEVGVPTLKIKSKPTREGVPE